MNIYPKNKLQEETLDGDPGEAGLIPPGGASESGSEWYWADGVPGTGEKPEWMLDKYKTVDQQAKGYSELAKKLGAHTGAPEEYALNVPESLNGITLDAENERLKNFLSFAKDNGVSQEFIDKALEFHLSELAQDLPDPEAIKAELGADADSRLQRIGQWGAANLDEASFEALRGMVKSAADVKAVEALIKLTRTPEIPTNITPNEGMTRDKVRKMMEEMDEQGRNKYETDPEFRKKVQQAYKDLEKASLL